MGPGGHDLSPLLELGYLIELANSGGGLGLEPLLGL